MSYARQYGVLDSYFLDRPMEHLVLGHAGAPVLVFPTSNGRFYQWEDFGMVQALHHHLAQGWLQLFCVDSIDQESWYNFDIYPREQIDRHLEYEAYILEEFLPLLRAYNGTDFLISTGTSFGAFHAVNFGFRHPHLCRKVVAMSGDYHNRKHFDDYFDDDIYYNSPVEFMANLTDPQLLAHFHRMEIVLATGDWDFCLEPTRDLSRVLDSRGIGHQFHCWNDPGIHDWPLWRQQAVTYL